MVFAALFSREDLSARQHSRTVNSIVVCTLSSTRCDAPAEGQFWINVHGHPRDRLLIVVDKRLSMHCVVGMSACSDPCSQSQSLRTVQEPSRRSHISFWNHGIWLVRVASSFLSSFQWKSYSISDVGTGPKMCQIVISSRSRHMVPEE
jgi:hypothetical protein